MTAFPEPARTLWTAYAESRRRPRRIHALAVEHRQATNRLAVFPPEPAPELESRDAYVRRSDEMLYVCPWETRLRSWLALERFRAEAQPRLAQACVPPSTAREAELDFERWKSTGRPLRPHIESSRWHVPLAWFVPFARDERCLMLGSPKPRTGGATTASGTRTLIYVTSMTQARRRIAAALPIVRANLGEHTQGLGAGRLETLGQWLADFHPHALVELDYGGLVHLLDDSALRADESVAEMSVAIEAMERGEVALTVAMYKRLLARWRPVRALEAAN
ncbi:hypothetical protein [Spirillospora sp. CA-294931]|uniref:hypothetical protein n=1 Tax=Spirillospora sp. CA-294931 TaxID=3240042 RepID=UPI003D8F5567